MIKVGYFEFSEVESKNHWVDFAKFGDLVKFDVQWFEDSRQVPFKLDPEKTYQVALDQSTSCAGVFIKDYTNTEVYMIECSRAKGQDADDFIYNFELFLHGLCEECHVSHLIYERPITTESFRSSQVLFQLEGMIRGLTKRYDEFKTARLEAIENSAWRRVVILPEYKNSPDRKSATQESVQRIFDWTNSYGFSLGKDKDVYEAIGVMFGWFMNSFDTLGRPYVRGDKYYGAIGGFILPFMSAEEVCSKLKEAGIDTTWAMQNPRKSTFENLASAVEKYKVVCVELTDAYSMLALTVECNIKWMDPDKMTVVLVAANFVDSRLFNITGKEYHFVV